MPRKMAKLAPQLPFGVPEVPVAVCTSRPVLQEGRKSANIHAKSAVSRGIPVNAIGDV